MLQPRDGGQVGNQSVVQALRPMATHRQQQRKPRLTPSRQDRSSALRPKTRHLHPRHQGAPAVPPCRAGGSAGTRPMGRPRGDGAAVHALGSRLQVAALTPWRSCSSSLAKSSSRWMSDGACGQQPTTRRASRKRIQEASLSPWQSWQVAADPWQGTSTLRQDCLAQGGWAHGGRQSLPWRERRHTSGGEGAAPPEPSPNPNRHLVEDADGRVRAAALQRLRELVDAELQRQEGQQRRALPQPLVQAAGEVSKGTRVFFFFFFFL